MYYRLHALPFGARNSVLSFAGFGAALQVICSRLFALVTSQYVDDFTQIAPGADEGARHWMQKVLALLGWKVQEQNDKLKEFAVIFHALGVVFDCGQLPAGVFTVMDKDGRVDGILELLDQACKAGKLSQAAAAELRGKLQFTRSQTFGRTGAAGLQALTGYEKGKPEEAWPLVALKRFLGAALSLQEAPPSPHCEEAAASTDLY